MLSYLHNRQQQQHTTDNNGGKSDPYVSFLLRQVTQKKGYVPDHNFYSFLGAMG